MSLNKAESDDADVQLTKNDVTLTFNMEVSRHILAALRWYNLGCRDGS